MSFNLYKCFLNNQHFKILKKKILALAAFPILKKHEFCINSVVKPDF